MTNQGHDETVTIRMPPKLLQEIDRASEKLKLTSLMNINQADDYTPPRSATIRFLIRVGLDHLKKRPQKQSRK